MTHDDALGLFRTGQFRELLSAYQRGQLATEPSSPLRAIVAYVAAHTDDATTATFLLAPFAAKAPTPVVRLQADTTLGLLSWRQGDFDRAHQHFISAVKHGRESKDHEQTAWALLHLFRFALEAQPDASLRPMLAEVRTAVHKPVCRT